MGAAKRINTDSHVVDILGSTRGRDQPIMLMQKALNLLQLIPDQTYHDENVVLLDPFCKAGEILLASALYKCMVKSRNKLIYPDYEQVERELYNGSFYGLAPDKRHYLLTKRTFLGNEKSHNQNLFNCIANGNYLSDVDGTLDEQKFRKEFNCMIELIVKRNPKAKIVAVGNPPYQESDGGGTGKSAIPVYNIFVEQLISSEQIKQFTVVIPSRWFAGGKGLNSFREELIKSKHIATIVNFSNSSDVFPTVDINGGVCFLHYDKTKKYETITFTEGTTSSDISLDGLDIIPDDPKAIELYRKIQKKWDGTWISEHAFPRNAFGIASNSFRSNSNTKPTSLRPIVCYFERKQLRYYQRSEIPENKEIINKYKVVVSKAAGGSKGNRRSTIPQSVIFVLKPEEVCSETYSIVALFETAKDANRYCDYLKTDFVRYFVGIRKITQNISRETWAWVPHMEMTKDWNDEILFSYFNLTKQEQAHIRRKVQEWS